MQLPSVLRKCLVIAGAIISTVGYALAEDVPLPADMGKLLGSNPVTLKVYEPHFNNGSSATIERSYVAYPIHMVLNSVLGENWATRAGSVRFIALDGYESVVDVKLLERGYAYLAFGMADGTPFKVDNVQQNEKDVDLSPWYLIWDDIGNDDLLKEGALKWPYQVAKVELAAAGDQELYPEGLDERFKPAGKLTEVQCLSCHKVNGYGGEKMGFNLAEVVKTWSRVDFSHWLLNPRSVKPDTTMPGLPPQWSEAERQNAANAIYDYLINVPVVPED